MTDSRQPPPRVVASYGAGIQARNAARQEERRNAPAFPNLAQAAVTHDPHDGRTLEQVAEQQRLEAQEPRSSFGTAPERAPLSPETVEGLRALHAEQAQRQAERPPAAQPPGPPAPPPEATEPAEVPPEPAAEETDPDDADFAAAMRRMQQDVIQNERERKAVAARVGPIDMSDVLTGEFTQVVPIVPGSLEVRFKCLTTAENNRLRIKVIEEVESDPKKAHLAKDLLGFYQTVATIVSINKTTFPKHTEINPGTLRVEFLDPIFNQKVDMFQQYPLPLVAALGTHSSWFEMRVRELFVTTDALKNG